MNLENTLKKGSQILKKNNICTHELDAQIILSNLMGIRKETLITNNTMDISEIIIEEYDIAIKRRVKREPVAHIIGKKEFWSEDFFVTRSTLIPRPETELLIYKLVKYFNNKKINILDIGTGSGCILLSILKELSSSRGIGIDISTKAIKIAFRLPPWATNHWCYKLVKFDNILERIKKNAKQFLKKYSNDILIKPLIEAAKPSMTGQHSAVYKALHW